MAKGERYSEHVEPEGGCIIASSFSEQTTSRPEMVVEARAETRSVLLLVFVSIVMKGRAYKLRGRRDT